MNPKLREACAWVALCVVAAHCAYLNVLVCDTQKQVVKLQHMVGAEVRVVTARGWQTRDGFECTACHVGTTFFPVYFNIKSAND